jgi:hypothetical protein
MTKQELIETVQRELDSSFALPSQLQPSEIERLIDQCSIWFYENYREAVETQYYIMRSSEFKTPEWFKTRTITMPECVVSVFEVKEITGAGLIGTIDKDLKYESDDIVIAHFLQLPERPPVKKVILSCHEKWWYPVGKVKQFWDICVFLHEEHRKYHGDYNGLFTIIPNIKENLLPSDKTSVKNIAGIIGTIEDRKQTHVSIQRALKDKCEKIYLFGHIGDQNYYDRMVRPLLNPRVEHFGHTTDKQS